MRSNKYLVSAQKMASANVKRVIYVVQHSKKITETEAIEYVRDFLINMKNTYTLTNESKFEDPIEGKYVMHYDKFDTNFANLIRRLMLSDIKTLAICNVQMLKNTSMYDDVLIADRLCMCPVIVRPSEESHMKYTITMNNSTEYSTNVLTDHIMQQNDGLFITKNICVCTLLKKQEISITFYIMEGIGRESAIHTPVAAVRYVFKNDAISVAFELSGHMHAKCVVDAAIDVAINNI